MARIVTTINGKFVRPEDARISVFDNSVMYAEGLFEMFLGIDDRVIFGEEHIGRLYRGAKLIDLKMPISREVLREWMVKTLRKHPSKVKKLRLTVTGGLSAKWFGKQGKPQVILNAGPHTIPTEPFRVLVTPFRLDERSEFRRIKTLSYTIHAASLKQAHEAGYDDALLLNNCDQVAEITSANIFWVERGTIYTPPLSSGCLDGTTRRVVFREAKKLGYAIVERNVTLAEMVRSEEVFLSSSTKLVLPITVVREGKREYRLPVGPVGSHLAGHFRKLVGLD